MSNIELQCLNCGTRNRVPAETGGARPTCRRCRATLDYDDPSGAIGEILSDPHRRWWIVAGGVFVLVMLLFPPWQLVTPGHARSQIFREAAGYHFIGHPPSAPLRTTDLDMLRLAIQALAVGVIVWLGPLASHAFSDRIGLLTGTRNR